ncbi:nuclear transport factor 2 family protein [Spelaeicoccus albus]|uniref:Ketosteroid isomerase-like protein n=1 Tax=Spelaeicoccus albus TaxID=1280376 RepID=A0A7Z0AAW8_9MICO|nr:nuclear transport factor 2 family protein [Spelaeicoccus albus]NYI66283.1 ketosteroid isomerase-like protein [Spelaeicoccus albus]
MTATAEQAKFVFEQWHQRIKDRDADGLAALYADDAELESPLVPRMFDIDTGVVQGREEIDRFVAEATKRRPDDELPSLYRSGDFMFDGETLTWEYPRKTPDGDQLDLVEVMELDGALIRRHRIYWGWRGTQHIIANAITKANR